MSTTAGLPDFPPGIALVVGGSGGIGQAICRRIARAGTGVALTYRTNRASAEAVAEAVREAGQQAVLLQADVADDVALAASIDTLAAQHGPIHSVVVATGYDIQMRMIGEVTPREWRAVIESDVNGFFNVVHATLPHLRAKDGTAGGSLVHIGSAGLLRWPARDVLSVAPKGAIQQLIKGIAREEGPHGIRANGIAIGVIETGVFLRLKETAFDQAWHDAVLSTLAVKRYGQPEEVAELAVFLASSRAGYVTGQMIALDGGWSL
jgi:NAD(P)-dependent dehydrogenase (short-subunit alcohol dehydrogenase family)